MKKKIVLLASALAMLLPAGAQAHRAWMLPSATVLSGDDVWVTVDAAISNDLFYFEHFPMRLEQVKAVDPDGAEAKLENAATGRYRSTFDVHLLKKGTYKIGSATAGVGGSYTLNGEQKRLPRGLSADQLASAVPAGATDVRLVESSSRNEIFVTVGAPTDAVLKPSGKGLELVPETHPNDLIAGEAANFRFTIDGKPAANIELTVIPGGNRYRDALNEMKLKTDAEGKVSINWPEAGMYWLNATAQDQATSIQAATQRRLSYVATLEVLAP